MFTSRLWIKKYIHSLRRFNHSALILLAFAGVILSSWYLNKLVWITPLILGVIAAALTETDDNLSGKLKAQGLTLVCFTIATFSIEFLFSHPLPFAIGLFTSAFGFIMLGAIGPRYATIAFGSLLIAIYTMLGADENQHLWYQPFLLLGGAVWYYLMSIIWYALWPLKPVQDNLSRVFEQLSAYMDTKRKLFHPVSDLTPQPYRIQEANLNAKTVSALNQCKATFLSRSKRGRVDGPSDRFLNIYFLAQDIHERVSSTHYRYQELAEAFSRSDIMFRFKHMMELQSESCQMIANSIREGEPYHHNEASTAALDELKKSIQYLEAQQNPEWKALLLQLNYLFENLLTVEKLLSNVSNPDVIEAIEDNELSNTDPGNITAMWERITANFRLSSPLFRHALRVSTALTAGFGVIQLMQVDRGYWILLTVLFVCQPNYSATRQKLVSRIGGTVTGLLIGGLLLTLFPSQASQLVFIVLSGVAFFAFKENNYSYATTFITILVLFCFHQIGEGYAVILPRLLDTLIGCLLAVGAVTLLLPDWQSGKLSKAMATSITTNQQYLAQIIGQYRIGKKDDLHYRVARRDAHNSSADLSSIMSNMLTEPGRYRTSEEDSFRFLTLNHALLSYISALGAHRTRIDSQGTHKLILDTHRMIHQHLDVLNQQLSGASPNCVPDIDEKTLEKRLSQWRDEDDNSVRMILQQLHLIYRMMPELHALAGKFVPKVNDQQAELYPAQR
ncbi:TIGR01666 family membrane protein [Vibrio sp. HA2012]|uniref:YccS family putative transporter n=1 Tax=Vibrio sp. HA2012 TaxID=1971595 RepID=UPI000C2B9907|nr:YccS family putative transporter [Vibrio sp. HA2012]PJC87365.1 TIGR01666 family membrane protein [Vibrio sp. HA2012]